MSQSRNPDISIHFLYQQSELLGASLKEAEFVYNNRPHADRSQSPFRLWYGLAPKAIPEAFEYHD